MRHLHDGIGTVRFVAQERMLLGIVIEGLLARVDRKAGRLVPGPLSILHAEPEPKRQYPGWRRVLAVVIFLSFVLNVGLWIAYGSESTR